jgi:hypothetical protein
MLTAPPQTRFALPPSRPTQTNIPTPKTVDKPLHLHLLLDPSGPQLPYLTQQPQALNPLTYHYQLPTALYASRFSSGSGSAAVISSLAVQRSRRPSNEQYHRISQEEEAPAAY